MADSQSAQPSAPPARETTNSTGRTVKRLLLAVLLVIVGIPAIVIAILLVNANILRGPISHFVSEKLERPFAINGDLRIGLFKHPHVEVNDVVLGNADWGSGPNMIKLEHAVVSIKLLPLLHGRVVLPEVRLTKPDILLERDFDGEANWAFGRPEDTDTSSSSNPPEIQSLWVQGGKIAFIDPDSETDVKLTLDSENGEGNAESAIRFAGVGSLRNEEFRLDGRAGSLLELKEGGSPYKLDVTARAGDTKGSFDGTVVPLKMETVDGEVKLSGKDLSKLYPLVPVPLPWTPAYSIAGHLVRDAQKYTMKDLKGKVGKSDINGHLSIDLSNKKPRIDADIVSKRLDYKDLAGFLGAPPPNKAQATKTPEQRKETVKRVVTGRILATKPYSLEKLRSVDADVKFKGESIITQDIPLDKVNVALKLKDGKLALAPLDFGLAGGHVVSQINLDASKDVIETRADATITNLEVKRLMPAMKEGAGSAGKLGGRIKLATKGNSVAQMAASANGELALIMGEGRLSTLALVLTNLDLANAIKYVIRGNPNAPVYCAVITANAKDGVVTPGIFVIDSSEEKIVGEGNVDMKSEEYNLRLIANSKRVSIAALRGPIAIGGTFRDPSVRPEIGPLALRGGAAIALGALLTPLASLLVLIDPGGAKDSNCSALMTAAKKEVATTPVTPPKQAAPTPEVAGKKAKGDSEKAAQ